MYNYNKYFLLIVTVISSSILNAGLTVGVQLVNYSGETLGLSNPTWSDPANDECLYNKGWVNPTDKKKGVTLSANPGSVNEPSYSQWGIIEFDNSAFSKCFWSETPFFLCPLLVNGQGFATVSFGSTADAWCGESMNGNQNCKKISIVQQTDNCLSGATNSACFQIIYGAPSNQFCITNANNYTLASAMCVGDASQLDYSMVVKPGETKCYATLPSVKTKSLSVAAMNYAACGESACDIACNMPSIDPLTVNANTTVTIGCDGSKSCEALDIGELEPTYKVISVSQNTNAVAEARANSVKKSKLKKPTSAAKKKTVKNKPVQQKK